MLFNTLSNIELSITNTENEIDYHINFLSLKDIFFLEKGVKNWGSVIYRFVTHFVVLIAGFGGRK